MKSKPRFAFFILLLLPILLVIFLSLRRKDPDANPVESNQKKQLRLFWQTYNRAAELRSKGQFEQAAEAYRSALKINPVHEDSLYYLGSCLLELGEYSQAVKIYEELIRLNPHSNRGLSQLGIILSTPAPGAVQDLLRAKELFERCAEINREESGPFVRMGLLALQQQDFETALHHFLTAGGFKSPEGIFLAGFVKFRQGKYAEAADFFRKVLDINSREKQISGRGVFSEGDVTGSSTGALTSLEKTGLKALFFLHWTAAKLGGYPPEIPPQYRIENRIGPAISVKQTLPGRKAWADYDQDGDVDAALVNRGTLKLYKQQNGEFQDVTGPAGLNGSDFWEPVWADYDSDGDSDLYVIGPGYLGSGNNVLFRNERGHFKDVTSEAGLTGRRSTVRSLWFDLDGDRDLDLVEGGNTTEDSVALRVLRNDGQRFQIVHQQKGISFKGNVVDLAFSDWNNDRQNDLLVMRWKRPLILYVNEHGTFTDVTEQAGLKGIGGNSYSGIFFDYNNDGLSDLLIAIHVQFEIVLQCLMNPVSCSTSSLRVFRNDSGKKFREVTKELGLKEAYGTMQVAAIDLNHDRWTDLVIANGGLEQQRMEPSAILRNIGGKRFEEPVYIPSWNSPSNARSLSVVDFDQDGEVEIYFDNGMQITPNYLSVNSKQ